MVYEVTINGKRYRMELHQLDGVWNCEVNGTKMFLDAIRVSSNTLSLLINGKSYQIRQEQTLEETQIWVDGKRYSAEVRDPRSFRSRKRKADHGDGPRRVTAPMPGKIVRVLVSEKSEVEAGQGLLVMEAMKMQNEVKSPKKGTVQKISANPGTLINAGDVLAIVE